MSIVGDQLQVELGEQWQAFLSAYQDILARLPPEPGWQDLDSAAACLGQLLSRSEYGRGLLHSYRVLGAIRTRGIQAPSQTLSDKESIQQICNRLRKLPNSASTVPDEKPLSQIVNRMSKQQERK